MDLIVTEILEEPYGSFDDKSIFLVVPKEYLTTDAPMLSSSWGMKG